jgi:hypothetical protein
MTRRIHLHIDRVVLTGVGRIDPVAFERALKAEIAGSLAQADRTGALKAPTSSRTLDGGRLAKPGDPAALGRRVVGRIVGGGS